MEGRANSPETNEATSGQDRAHTGAAFGDRPFHEVHEDHGQADVRHLHGCIDD